MQRARALYFPTWTDSIATIGVFCHEFGHVLGLPDFYDVLTAVSRVGAWDIMDAGTWARVQADPARSLPGAVPARFSAWSRMFLGWSEPIALAPPAGDVAEASIVLTTASTGGAAFQLRANPFGVDWTAQRPGAGEFFLAEVRTQEGWDAGLPGEGVLVYHVDESRPGNVASAYADGAGLLLLAAQDGSAQAPGATDPWPGAQSGFGPDSSPSSDLHDGSESGVDVVEIGTVSGGSATLTAVVANLASTLALPFARPQPFAPARHAQVGLVLSLATSPVDTHVEIFDLRGRRVRTLRDAGDFSGGGRVAHWDGRSDSGAALPSGVYWFRSATGGAGKVVLLRD
jgi:hypothetical protein